MTDSMRTGRRALLALAGAGPLALALSGCGGREEIAAPLAEVLDPVSFDLAEMTALPDDLDHAVDLPGIRYRVAATAMLQSIEAGDAEDLGIPAPPDAEAETWHVPAGQRLLVAELVAQTPELFPATWPAGNAYTDRVVLGGEEISTVVGPLVPPGSGQKGLPSRKIVCALVPEDIGGADAVLEVRDGEVTQRLSLLDGTRISSDIEPWYQGTISATAERTYWERTDDDRFEDGPILAGCVLGAQISATREDGTWPAADHVMLGVEVSVIEPLAGTAETSTLVLRLPDGTEVSPTGDPSAPFASRGASPAWFEIPRDLETVTAHIALALSADGTDLDYSTEDVALTLTTEER